MKTKKSDVYKGIGLYIHFPFCVKKCNYCDFVSFPFDKNLSKKYFNYLKKEVKLFLKQYPDYGKFCVYTLYFGGGTPSLIEPEYLADFLSFLKMYFDFSTLEEFTMEGNPESVIEEKFKVFKELGVNRVSLGVQSLNNDTLRLLGRIHTAENAIEKYYLLRTLGFNNINLDLIFALPNETLEQQIFSLKRAISLSPEHISYYSLMLERGTYLNKMKSKMTLPDEKSWLKEYEYGRKLLEDNGFIHYEISNFGKDGFVSKHNLMYWKSFPYVGFGISAGGFLGNMRYVNVKKLPLYFSKLDEGTLPYSFKKRLSTEELKSEYMFMGLRLIDGIDMADYFERFGGFLENAYSNSIAKLEALNLIKIGKNHLKLTKKGLRFANEVFREFID